MNQSAGLQSWQSLLWIMLYFGIATSLLPPVLFFEQGSDGLVVQSLSNSQDVQEPSPFMSREDPRVGGKFTPYYSQFGLTYRVLLPFRAHLPENRLEFILSMAWALATGAVLWWFQCIIATKHGTSSGSVFLVLCCATPTFLFFSASLYWQLPLLLAPFLVAYARATERPALTIACVSILLFLRFLGGYEYASTLILAPIAAVLLRLSCGDVAPRPAVRYSFQLGAAGLVAFIGAVSLHLATLAHMAGGWQEGISRFSEVAESRTFGDFMGRPPSVRDDIISLINSFFRNEVMLVIGLAVVTVFLTATVHGRTAAVKSSATLGFAFLCGLSWQMLARGHMRDHAHINFIVYLMPFGLCVYLMFARVVGGLVEARRP